MCVVNSQHTSIHESRGFRTLVRAPGLWYSLRWLDNGDGALVRHVWRWAALLGLLLVTAGAPPGAAGPPQGPALPPPGAPAPPPPAQAPPRDRAPPPG